MRQLRAGAWEAVIWPERGARVLALRYRGQPVLREPPDPARLDREPMLYGMPFLFPPNRVRDGRFTFLGRTYSLPLNEPARHNHIHGTFSEAPFAVLAAEPTRLITRFEEPGNDFPFPARITMTDTLSPQGLSRETCIENTGPGPMPVEIGFHTTFSAPGAFSVPLRDRWETDDRFLPTGRLLPLNELEQGIVRGAGPRGVRVSGFYRSAGPLAGVGPFGYRVSASFTDWVLFARPGEDWISIEPQSGPVDGFNRPDVCTLASGASVCFAQAIGLYAALQAP